MSNKPLPVVAIVGRPNVGKSSLFNRLLKKRRALVDATPGLTRDRLYADVEWRGVRFRIADTGGIQLGSQERIAKGMMGQVAKAMREAALALFVCDARHGPLPLDQEAASWMRPFGKLVVLAVNKVDSGRQEGAVHEFSSLGLGVGFPVSALHGLGIGDLLDEVVQRLKSVSSVQLPVSESEAGHVDAGHGTRSLRVAIVGRPNVGKSSLINRLLNEERILVDEIPGTTRDPVEVQFLYQDQPYSLVDTAGIRARARLKAKMDVVARIKALEAMEGADVCLGVLDATVGLVRDDLRVLDEVVSAFKPLCLAVNKWDLLPPGTDPKQAASGIVRRAPFLRFAPVVPTSAKTGLNVLRALELASSAAKTAASPVPAQRLVELTALLQEDPKAPPAVRYGGLKEISQVRVSPPTFHLIARPKRPFAPSDIAYLEAVFRRELGFKGVPLRIQILRRPG
ncbi:MAG: ribosome biogenesis GTPase Der [Candidatus Omnitrophica bacterium]|nr:ribosome biogenesis GTPase Der [Candidatus Omnitrophota bacterium]